MAYSGTIRRCLISSPSDVATSDLTIVRNQMNRWNGVYGHTFATAVIPISWGTHAAAEFGQAPQEILNKQLVDRCDMCIAIFATRLGTETRNAESGTAEEIERLADANKYVGVLRSLKPIESVKNINATQLRKLDKYLNKISDKSLVMDYKDDAELVNRIDAMLTWAVSSDQSRSVTELAHATGIPQSYAEVWPRVESEDRIRTSPRGELRTSRNWYLVLTNTGNSPARDVRITVEAPDGGPTSWGIHGISENGQPDVEILAPNGGEARFPIFMSLASGPQSRCTVTWTDERGEQSNTATLQR
jgi:hypothetical protein